MVFKADMCQTDFVMHAAGQNWKHELYPCVQVYDNQLNQLKWKRWKKEKNTLCFCYSVWSSIGGFILLFGFITSTKS